VSGDKLQPATKQPARLRRYLGRAASVPSSPRIPEGLVERSRRLRRRYSRGPLRDIALDALMLTAAAVAALASAPAAGIPDVDIGWLAAFSVIVLLLLAYSGIYRPSFGSRFLDDLRSILAATAVAAMSVTFIEVLLTDAPEDAAGQAVREWLFAATYLAAGRAGTQLVRSSLRRRGEAMQPTLILGAGRVGHLVARRLLERPEFGLKPVAYFDYDPLEIEGGPRLPVVGARSNGGSPDRKAFVASFESAVREFGVENVIVTFSLHSHDVELELVRRCQEMGLSVSLVPRLFEGVTDQTKLERLGGIPLVSVHPSDPRGWQFAVKYALDRVFAAIAIVLLSPVLLITAIAIRLTLGSQILFRQPRVGLDGREFDLLKFRTMRPPSPDAPPEPQLGAAVSSGVAPGGVEGADRRTALGSFLRSVSLDELPQLFNVLKGEMSLVGPRPERTAFAREFDHAVYRYGDRQRVKSGITGWAQVHGLRGKTSLADRVEWDNYYIENWSLWLDFKIVLMTIRAALRDRSE
jgi:exopolysaccharide biosynthesis polyprenyl glycosylphosphotransferase